MSILEKGKPYHSLPDVTIIYLTKDDFIGDKRGCYNICRKPDGQDVTMCLENGLHEKYYNLEYPTNDMKVNELLRYFRHSDPFYKTENFPGIVERVRFYKIKEEGREEGRALGRLEGKAESVLALLEDLGQIPQKIIDRISQESNPEQLGKWLKCAARVSSIAEFREEMKIF